MPQFARPASQVDNNGPWSAVGGPSNTWEAIDEVTANDATDYIQSPANPIPTGWITFGLSSVQTPSVIQYTFRYKWRKNGGGRDLNVVGKLTSLSFGLITITPAATGGTQWNSQSSTSTVNPPNGWASLRVRFEAETFGGGSPTAADVTWAEMETGDAGATTHEAQATLAITATRTAGAVLQLPIGAVRAITASIVAGIARTQPAAATGLAATATITASAESGKDIQASLPVTATIGGAAQRTHGAGASLAVTATPTAGAIATSFMAATLAITETITTGGDVTPPGGGTPPQFRSWSVAQASGGSVSVAAPAGHQADDILIAQVMGDSSTSAISAAGDGYALLTGPTGSSEKMWLYWKRATSSAEPNTTWTLTLADDIEVIISAYSGAHTTATPVAVDQYNGTPGGSANAWTHPFPNITPGQNNSLVVAFVGIDGSSGETNGYDTWGGSFVERYDYSEPAFTTQREMWMAAGTFGQSTAALVSGITVTSHNLSNDPSITAMLALAPAPSGTTHEGQGTLPITATIAASIDVSGAPTIDATLPITATISATGATPQLAADASLAVTATIGATASTGTPYRIPNPASGGQVIETQDFCGPIVDTNGNLYAIIEGGSGDSLAYMMKSTNGGITWAEMDGAGKPTNNDNEAFWMAQDPSETGLVRAIHIDSSFNTYAHEFRTSDHATNPDTWGTNDVLLHNAVDGPLQCVSLVINSVGDTYAFFVVDAEATYNKFAYRRKPKGQAWDATVIMDQGQNVGIKSVHAVMGANDKVHIFGHTAHLTPNQVWHRSLTSGGVLSAWERVDSTGTHTQEHPMINAVYHDVGGVERVHVGWRDGSSMLRTGHIDNDGTPVDDGVASVSAIDGSFLQNSSAMAALAIDGNRLYTLYSPTSDRDLYVRSRDGLGSWGSEIKIRDSISVQWIFANIYTRAGQKRLGFLYEAGGTEFDPLFFYGELNLAQAAATLPITATLTAAADVQTPAKEIDATLAVTATIGATAAREAPIAATLPVTATVTTTGLRTAPAQATLAVTATRTAGAVVTKFATATLAVTASISSAATRTAIVGATLAITSTRTAGVTRTQAAGATLAITATRTAGATRTQFGAATLAITSTRTAAATLTKFVTATLAVTATISSAAVKTTFATASLPVTATITSTIETSGSPEISGTLPITATISSAATAVVTSAATLPVTATVVSGIERTRFVTASLPVTATVSTSAARTFAVSASLPVTATVTTVGALEKFAAATLAVTATTVAAADTSGFPDIDANLNITATIGTTALAGTVIGASRPITATITSGADRTAAIGATREITATITTSGAAQRFATASLPVTSTIVADALVTKPVAATGVNTTATITTSALRTVPSDSTLAVTIAIVAAALRTVPSGASLPVTANILVGFVASMLSTSGLAITANVAAEAELVAFYETIQTPTTATLLASDAVSSVLASDGTATLEPAEASAEVVW